MVCAAGVRHYHVVAETFITWSTVVSLAQFINRPILSAAAVVLMVLTLALLTISRTNRKSPGCYYMQPAAGPSTSFKMHMY